MNPSIFKTYDIRGVYPTDMSEEAMVVIVRVSTNSLRKS